MAEKDKTKTEVGEITQQKAEIDWLAVLCYVCFLIPLLSERRKDSFVTFHLEQGIILILWLVLCRMVFLIPLMGWVSGAVGYVMGMIMWIFGVRNAGTGRKEKLPWIGDMINFKIKWD